MRQILLITTLLLIWPSIAIKPLHAAQIIQSTPVELKANWSICRHYSDRAFVCNKGNLPEKLQKLEPNLVFTSYQKSLIIHRSLRKEMVSLSIAHIDEADKVFFNGKKIGQTGDMPPNFETGYRLPRTYVIPSELIKFDQFNQLEIRAFSSRQISSIRNSAPVLGGFYQQLHRSQESDYLYIGLVVTFILLITFQIFYLIMIRTNNENAFLLIFFFSMTTLTFIRSQIPYHLGFDTNLNLKLESFLYASTAIGLTLFLFEFFEFTIRKIDRFLLFLLGISGTMSLVWFSPLHIRLTMEANQLLVATTCGWLLSRPVILALIKQRTYSAIIASIILIFWLAVVLDTAMDSSFLSLSDYLFTPSLLPVIASVTGVVLALTLTHKYWQFFKGATYDHLTGTMLRPAFFQRLSEEMQRSYRSDTHLLVAVIDIRQVRKLTANYGQGVSNQLLGVVSNALTKVLRPFDLLCRFNDDEFCVAATVGSADDANSCLNRIYEELAKIQQPVDEETEILLDAKIGGVLYQSDNHLSVSQLIQDANYALAKCKNEANMNYFLLEASQRMI